MTLESGSQTDIKRALYSHDELKSTVMQVTSCNVMGKYVKSPKLLFYLIAGVMFHLSRQNLCLRQVWKNVAKGCYLSLDFVTTNLDQTKEEIYFTPGWGELM